MPDRVRIGAVSYLNTRPLVHGLQDGPAAGRIDLTFDDPAALARRLRHEELDIALLPTVELARIPELTIVPGLGITCRGATRSVLLVSRAAPSDIRSVSLDPESRTSNALVQVLFDRVWRSAPTFRAGSAKLDEALEGADAAVRIGDKALFEPVPAGYEVHDLGTVWTDATGLPFVFAVWACRPGVLDREIYGALHAARRAGSRALPAIAAAYEWNGRRYPDIALAYLRDNIRFRLGSDELRAIRSFHTAARDLGLIDVAPELELGFRRWTTCHDAARAAGSPT